MLDGEIAAPDERGVTHIDALTEALRQRRPERLAYFAFDLLHLDGHDLRPCAIEDRKALARDVIGSAGCERIVCVDHVTSGGAALFEAVRQIGAEGIVSKRAGSSYSDGAGRDWLKTKVSESAAVVITGYIEREAVAVAELKDGALVPAGLVKFGLAGKGLWPRLERRRAGPASRAGIIPVRPELVAGLRYFGRYRSPRTWPAPQDRPQCSPVLASTGRDQLAPLSPEPSHTRLAECPHFRFAACDSQPLGRLPPPLVIGTYGASPGSSSGLLRRIPASRRIHAGTLPSRPHAHWVSLVGGRLINPGKELTFYGTADRRHRLGHQARGYQADGRRKLAAHRQAVDILVTPVTIKAIGIDDTRG